MTDPEPHPRAADGWQQLLDTLRRRYPGQKDSVLFCVHKLQQNHELTLRDFRAEARLHGIPMAGRALHSARQLLGLAPAPSRAVPEVKAPRRAARQRTPLPPAGEGEIEAKVVRAVQQIQTAAGADAARLKRAILEAIALLQDALRD